MKLNLNVELRYGGRSGVEARSPDLQLTSHGVDEEEALQSLQRGIVAWCEGLRSVGKLENALRHKGLKWESNGELILVKVESYNRNG